MNVIETLEKNPVIAGFAVLTLIVGTVISTLNWLDNRVDTKITEQARLQGQSTPKHAESTIPIGAVVAFHIPDGCPKGWVRFELADGRSIIGVGSREYQYYGNTTILQPPIKRNERIKLQPQGTATPIYIDTYETRLGETSAWLGGPEYVGLLYCKKVSE